MPDLISIVQQFIPLLLTLTIVMVSLSVINWLLKKSWKNEPDSQFRFQLIMLALTFIGILSIIVALPISNELRGQLLSLIGILLSAAIALSSTTFIGNIMAGIMLKVVKQARPGDFIRIEDMAGRITEMGLLHSEIQTEFRDLVTLPNIYMVTRPLHVVRASGTIVTVEVSLGYDILHTTVSDSLCRAIKKSGLTDPFVQVRQLGDFSITYRAAGFLEDGKKLLSAKPALRAAILDALHADGIEIVSPSFMNTRAQKEGSVFIPKKSRRRNSSSMKQVDDIAFDKAEEAAAVEKIRSDISDINKEIADLEATELDKEALNQKESELDARKSLLAQKLQAAEKVMEEKDRKESGS